MPRMSCFSGWIAIAFLVSQTNVLAETNIKTVLNAPTQGQGDTFAPQASIEYGGTVTWNAGDPVPQRVLVQFEFTYYSPYDDSRNYQSGSSGVASSKYANADGPGTATSLKFTSAQVVTNGVTYPAAPLTAGKVNGYTSYYWVTANPVGEGSAPLFIFQPKPAYAANGWYYCR